MKLLFTALLCLLLSGCSLPADAPAEAATSLAPPQETVKALQSQYGSAVEAVSLPFSEVQQLWYTDLGLLLQNGNELALLDHSFGCVSTCTLDFTPVITCQGQLIAAFDPESRQLLLLNDRLEAVRCITLPQGLLGNPIAGGEKNICYCTDTGLYSWDLESGIRRRIRETDHDQQTLIGLHLDGTVLQYRIRENDRERDLFVDAQSGQLLQEMDVTAQLLTAKDRYYCIFSSGAVENLVFGSKADPPQGLYPDTSATRKQFLPGNHAAVTLEVGAEGNMQLTCYDLESGRLWDHLQLFHTPKAILDGGDGSILVLICENNQDVLLNWQLSERHTSGKQYTDTYYTADHPDHAGLTVCRDHARSLSELYGPEILLWKDAIAAEPWDYTFEPEHRCQVLLDQLQTLETALARYPKELLVQTTSHFDTLKICLVQRITGTAGAGSLHTATGIQFQNGANAYVVLAAGPYLEQALYHELFHVMETHILSCSNALDRWNELNPAGFSYDLDHAANAQRNSGVYLENGTRAFVDTYSMSFPREDRARIFEYAMLPDMEHLFRSEIMQNKLQVICTGIREAYGLKRNAETFPWEQYLQ